MANWIQKGHQIIKDVLFGNKHLFFITLVNFTIVGFGIAKTLLAVRWLGAASYGAVAILSSLAALSINFIDVRLWDIATKSFFLSSDDFHARQRHQRVVVQSTLLGTFLMALAACVLGVFVTQIGEKFALKTVQADFTTILLCNIAHVLIFASAAMPLFLRLIEKTAIMGFVRLTSQFLNAVVFLIILHGDPTIKGFFVAALWAQLTGFAFVLAALFYCFYRHQNIRLWRGFSLLQSWAFFVQERRNIFGGNLFGYTKMLHRGADTLLVGLLSDEVAAGIYRLARQLLDAMNIFYDSLQQILMPKFFHYLSEKNTAEFRTLAKQILLFSALFALVAAIGAFLTLPLVDHYFLNSQYPYIGICTSILCLTFFFIAGIHIWLWPLLMTEKKIVEFSWFSLTAAALQWGATWLLTQSGMHAAIAASFGMLSYYIFLYPAAAFRMKTVSAP